MKLLERILAITSLALIVCVPWALGFMDLIDAYADLFR